MEFHDLDVMQEKRDDLGPLGTLDIGIKNMADKKNINAATKAIAIAIMNKNPNHPNLLIRWHIRNKEKKLIRFLKWNLSSSEIYRILTLVVRQMEVNDFLGFMVSVKGMSLMETGNHRTNGDSFKGLSNISDSQEKKSSGNIVGQI